MSAIVERDLPIAERVEAVPLTALASPDILT
jgi:hypothetical protein